MATRVTLKKGGRTVKYTIGSKGKGGKGGGGRQADEKNIQGRS
jgi:hypothetical protein